MHPGTPANPLEVDCRSVADRIAAGEPFLLLDCREPDEQAICRISQARLLPMSELADRIAELDAYRERSIVVHCHHGGRSLRVARWLCEQGFSAAASMAGGIDQWSIEIDPSLPRY